MHTRNLATHSEVFPDGDLAINNEVVLLTEDSATLELLFQYMYRQPQPDITELPFERLSKLAEAAEKYRVFSAMEICRIMMMCVSFTRQWSMLTYGWNQGGPARSCNRCSRVWGETWILQSVHQSSATHS